MVGGVKMNQILTPCHYNDKRIERTNFEQYYGENAFNDLVSSERLLLNPFSIVASFSILWPTMDNTIFIVYKSLA